MNESEGEQDYLRAGSTSQGPNPAGEVVERCLESDQVGGGGARPCTPFTVFWEAEFRF